MIQIPIASINSRTVTTMNDYGQKAFYLQLGLDLNRRKQTGFKTQCLFFGLIVILGTQIMYRSASGTVCVEFLCRRNPEMVEA